MIDELPEEIRKKILMAKISGEEYTEPELLADRDVPCDVCDYAYSEWHFFDVQGVEFRICMVCYEKYHDNDDAIGILPIREPY
jgi:mRNA-degrading endonuclease HigB of HigAB toxin-antitoxin module